jgi:DNA excision repair protein ERCC-6
MEQDDDTEQQQQQQALPPAPPATNNDDLPADPTVRQLVRRAAASAAAAASSRPQTVLLPDLASLPRGAAAELRDVRRVDNAFWRAGASSSRAAHSLPGGPEGRRPKRAQTLPRRAPASATAAALVAVATGGGRRRGSGGGGGSEEEADDDDGSGGGGSAYDASGDEDEGDDDDDDNDDDVRVVARRTPRGRGRGRASSVVDDDDDDEQEEGQAAAAGAEEEEEDEDAALAAAAEEADGADEGEGEGAEDEPLDPGAEYDDCDPGFYAARLARFRATERARAEARREAREERRRRRREAGGAAGGANAAANDADADDASEDADEEEDVEFEGGFRVPGRLYSRLFEYQRTGVKWMWELHTQRVGGVIGDEMGLGKTVQVAAYLGGLEASGLLRGRPALVVAPATVLRQWVRELRAWHPPLRVFLAHESGRSPPPGAFDAFLEEEEEEEEEEKEDDDEGSAAGAAPPPPPPSVRHRPAAANTEDHDDDDHDDHYDPRARRGGSGGGTLWQQHQQQRGRRQQGGAPAQRRCSPHRNPTRDRPPAADLFALAADAAHSLGHPCVVVTTYEALRLRADAALPIRWACAALDEGHRIRNPDAALTLAAKRLRTPHRLVVTGSPVQNRLSELWSIFDFVFPGKLGTLPVFEAAFALPITLGGYATASPSQAAAAYRCAVALRELISPYLLRRRKADVAQQLPAKSEHVLFCTLAREQLDLYRAYLASPDVAEVLDGKRRSLAAIDVLRKICNHPDLLERAQRQGSSDYGNPSRSGKLRVAERVLEGWQEGGHKALVFAQTQQTLDVLERLAKAKGWRYHRMDGGTGVAQRARLVDDFNRDPRRFLFLLTTRVGGLGVNLTGADRVLIYDPDW